MTIDTDITTAENSKSDLSRISENVDRTLASTNSTFIKCPKCGLPTHIDHEGRTSYCATCGEEFSIVSEESGSKKLEKLVRTTSRKTKIIATLLIVMIIVVIVTVGLSYFFFQKEPDYIDIHDVNSIRGLPIAEDVPTRTISSSGLDEKLKEMLDSEQKEDILDLEWIYKSLFIIPETWDLLDIYENESSGGGIAGFYVPEEEKMYVVGGMHSEEYVNYVLSHEFTHALQDQNFDLETYMDSGNYDGDFAKLCAIEGDATLTMEKWSEENLNQVDELVISLEALGQLVSSFDFESVEYSNEVLSEMAYYPYIGGLDFVKKIYDEGGYDAVNLLFTTKPPLSSEQIMHFDKYVEYEEPDVVSFNGDTSGLTLELSTTIGEKLLSEMLIMNDGTSGNVATAAPGWGGDRLYVYRSGDDFLTVLVTHWDAPYYNEGFSSAYDQMLSNIGHEEDGIHNVRGNFLHKESSEDRTVIYYSNSMEILESSFD